MSRHVAFWIGICAASSVAPARATTFESSLPAQPVQWSNAFNAVGLEYYMRFGVETMAVYRDELVLGGEFTGAGTLATPHLVRWDGTRLRPLGAGPGSEVVTMAVYGDLLIVALRDRLLTWNGSTWSPLASLHCAAMTIWEGRLIVAGNFESVSGVQAHGIAAWDGTSWLPLGGGCSGIRALEVYQGTLVAGGDLEQPVGPPLQNVAAWDGLGWQSLGHGPNRSVACLAVHAGRLIAAGEFDASGDVVTPGIAAWDGAGWRALPGRLLPPSELAPQPWRLASYRGELYLSAFFDARCGGVARWNGQAWRFITPPQREPDFVNSLIEYRGELIAGGNIGVLDGRLMRGAAAWDGDHWRPLIPGGGFALEHQLPGAVFATALYRGELIAAGQFDFAGDRPARSIARWDGTSWQSLGSGVDGEVRALIVQDDALFVGGEFSHAGGIEANNVARWDGQQWDAVGAGFPARVRTLVVHDGGLVAGGGFNDTSARSTPNIARWDGTAWQPLGIGPFRGEIRSLVIYGDKLVAGGSFTTEGWNSMLGVAVWTGDRWEPVGSGIRGWVCGLAVRDNDLFAAGLFVEADGANAPGVARWDGTTWNAIGDGAPDALTAITIHAGQPVVASFRWDTSTWIANVRRWDGQRWDNLGAGQDGWIDLLASQDGSLVVGGSFHRFGGVPAVGFTTWTERRVPALPPSLSLPAHERRAALELRIFAGTESGAGVRIEYGARQALVGELGVYDVRGRIVRSLVTGTLDAGTHVVNWNGRDRAGGAVASGIYFVQLSSAGERVTRKLAWIATAR